VTWTVPWILTLLAVPAGLLAAAAGYFRWKARLSLTMGEGPVLVRLVDPIAGRFQRVKALLFLLALALIAVALAGPRWGQEFQQVRRRGVDVIIAVDVSASMLAEDVKPNRLTQAKRELGQLINGLEGDRVGVVAFAGAAFLQCPLTLDYSAARSLLDLVGPELIPRPGTSLAAAIQAALEAYPPNTAKNRALVLLTDGEDHGGALDAAVKRAAEAGVRIFPIGFGNPSGEIIPFRDENGNLLAYKKDAKGQTVVSKMDEAALRSLADKTEGAYFPATEGEIEVSKVLEAVNRLEKRELESRVYGVGRNHFRWPLAFALLLLVLDFFWPEVRGHFRRVAGDIAKFRGFGKSLWMGVALVLTLSSLGHALGRMPGSKELSPAAQERPGDPQAQFNLGHALYNEGSFAASAETFKKAAAARGRPGLSDGAVAAQNPVIKSAALYNAGTAMFRQGKLEDAVEEYKAALRLNPSDPDAKHNLEMAQRLLKQPSEKKPQDSKQKDSRGRDKQDPKEGQGQAEAAPQPKPGQMSKEDAERLLNAVAEQEKEARRKTRGGKPPENPAGADW